MKNLIIALAFLATSCGSAMTPALAHVALAKSCEKEQLLIVEKAERECVDPVCVAACADDEPCKCTDATCTGIARAALEASNLACEIGLARLKAEADAMAEPDGGT